MTLECQGVQHSAAFLVVDVILILKNGTVFDLNNEAFSTPTIDDAAAVHDDCDAPFVAVHSNDAVVDHIWNSV